MNKLRDLILNTLLNENAAANGMGDGMADTDIEITGPNTDALFKNLSDLEDTYIGVNEKKLNKLRNEEESARDEENFVEVQNIKEEQVDVLERLIEAYGQKIEYLQELKDSIGYDIESNTSSGAGIFKDKEIHEFSDDAFSVNDTLKISTISTDTVIKKVDEHHPRYSVVKSSINNIKSGDIFILPKTFAKGGEVKINVSRGGNVLSKPFSIKNVTSITRNPS